MELVGTTHQCKEPPMKTELIRERTRYNENATTNNSIRVDHPLYVAFLRHMVRTQDWDVDTMLRAMDCPWRWQDEFSLFVAAHENHVPTLAEMHEWERVQQELDEAEHGTICATCHGSGESKGGSMVCLTCKGTGGAY